MIIVHIEHLLYDTRHLLWRSIETFLLEKRLYRINNSIIGTEPINFIVFAMFFVVGFSHVSSYLFYSKHSNSQ